MKKVARKKVNKADVKKTTVKIASALLIGDTIVEEGLDSGKLYKYRATGFPVPCSPFKTHVQVDYQRVWCYDAGMPVDVLVS